MKRTVPEKLQADCLKLSTRICKEAFRIKHSRNDFTNLEGAYNAVKDAMIYLGRVEAKKQT